MSLLGVIVPSGGVGVVAGVGFLVFYLWFARSASDPTAAIGTFVAGMGCWAGARLLWFAALLADDGLGPLVASRPEIAAGGIAVMAVSVHTLRVAVAAARSRPPSP